MTKKNSKFKAHDFNDDLNEWLKDKDFKAGYDEYGRQLDIAYKSLQLRKARKMSQAALAKKIGTTQSNIARFESGNENVTIAFLGKLCRALDCDLKISMK